MKISTNEQMPFIFFQDPAILFKEIRESGRKSREIREMKLIPKLSNNQSQRDFATEDIISIGLSFN